VPPGDYRELKRLLFGLLLVVCSTRTLHVVLDAVDLLSVDRPQSTVLPGGGEAMDSWVEAPACVWGA
jgi:hypothetical protein